jgi:hypothetical protein
MIRGQDFMSARHFLKKFDADVDISIDDGDKSTIDMKCRIGCRITTTKSVFGKYCANVLRVLSERNRLLALNELIADRDMSFPLRRR